MGEDRLDESILLPSTDDTHKDERGRGYSEPGPETTERNRTNEWDLEGDNVNANARMYVSLSNTIREEG